MQHREVRLTLVRGAHGFMYLSAAVAGLYGFVRPASPVAQMYGEQATYVLLVCFIVGGIAGITSYITRYIWVELFGLPPLFGAVAMAGLPFIAHGSNTGARSLGWLCVALAALLVARWKDVRELRERIKRLPARNGS